MIESLTENLVLFRLMVLQKENHSGQLFVLLFYRAKVALFPIVPFDNTATFEFLIQDSCLNQVLHHMTDVFFPVICTRLSDTE
jgi:hypothetical protein